MTNETAHVVIARYSEDLSWVAALPERFEVYIYNKGAEIAPDVFRNRPVHIIARPNVGRESETYAYHLCQMHNKCADWTFFMQGDPFAQAPNIMALLASPPPFPLYVPLGNQWLTSEGVPPPDVLEEYTKRTGKLYRFERMSTRTIIPIIYHDQRGYNIGRNYLRMVGKPEGTNIVRHFLGRIGLRDWIHEELEVINLMWGATFGVSRTAILQHPQVVYQRLHEESIAHAINGYLIERCWCVLFDRSLAQTLEP